MVFLFDIVMPLFRLKIFLEKAAAERWHQHAMLLFKEFLLGVFIFTAFSIEMSVSKQCRP